MLRYSWVFVVGLGLAGTAAAASWADAMFEELSRDFGSVPRGPMLTHPFRLTNKTDTAVHIANVRVSCGCVSAYALQHDLAPGQSTAIVAQLDTRRFYGVKAITVYVQFDQPRWEEVRLWLQANSRDDVMLVPEALAFGRTKRGMSPATSLKVNFLGNGQWRILEARCDSNYIQAALAEFQRDDNEVAYQLTARLRPDTPAGKWYSDIWLTTNNPATPRIRVPLTVEIESALSISPGNVQLGQVQLGSQAERRIIVRGVKPFRITGVIGTDRELNVHDSTKEPKPVHVLTVTLKPDQVGEVNRTIQLITDLKDEGEIEFQAKAQVIP